MRNQVRLVMLLGGASVVAGATFLVACSDDTSVTAGTEAGSDARSDAPNNPDGAVGDGGADTSPPFDGGFQVGTFDTVIATELCKSLARCCFGNPTPPDGGADGGSLDLAACLTYYRGVGFEGSNANSDLRDGGNVSLDQVAADACISKIKAMSCNLPGPEFKAIRAGCFAAYSGKIAEGAPCKQSIECKLDHFCKGGSRDGGVGTCAQIRAVGGNCGDFTTDQGYADQACSYRAGGNTGAYCRSFDIAAGVYLPAADWKCTAAGGAGTECLSSLNCNETICSEEALCVTPNKYFDPYCSSFAVP